MAWQTKSFVINVWQTNHFFLNNYKPCTDQCVYRFDKLIDLRDQTPIYSSSYRAKQIDYYNFLVERECNLKHGLDTTCFVDSWDEQAFLKLRTQDCGITRNVVLVALFSIYTLVPFIRVSQTRQTNFCEGIECKGEDKGEKVCPAGWYCAGNSCAAAPFQDTVVFEQERVFRELT